jgi:hypothetical protein
VFGANQIGQAPDSERRVPKVFEFPLAVKRGGIEYYMAMNMFAVCMNGHDESVFFFS